MILIDIQTPIERQTLNSLPESTFRLNSFRVCKLRLTLTAGHINVDVSIWNEMTQCEDLKCFVCFVSSLHLFMLALWTAVNHEQSTPELTEGRGHTLSFRNPPDEASALTFGPTELRTNLVSHFSPGFCFLNLEGGDGRRCWWRGGDPVPAYGKCRSTNLFWLMNIGGL